MRRVRVVLRWIAAFLVDVWEAGDEWEDLRCRAWRQGAGNG